MHDDEVAVTADDVRRLLAAQRPELAALPVTPHAEAGTDHRLFLLGDASSPGGALLARLPRIGWAAEQAASDARWLPRLAPHLPLAVPAPVAVGHPDGAYPFPWSIVPWLPGRAVGDPLGGKPLGFDAEDGARALGAFVRALRSLDPTDGPLKEGTSRGVPLERLDPAVREALDAIAGSTASAPPVDVSAADRAWERALAAPPAPEPTWIHGDLLPGNLLAHDGALTAVIDWGALGVGDPAVDLCPAWWLFDGGPRVTFLAEATVGVPDDVAAAAVDRARGWVLVQAAIAIPYYDERWPAFAAAARRRLAAVLADDDARRRWAGR
ncbi:aminoglycoside phosphotransferase [Xylanimonas cellulosilytica DSM 15894]|uniref:Aminoglycoside phosphotransferase n=1 Tax=Xylanimonas cellulosilytica (strain DSM 15894 / JCM 12276 / CECT 5975 / KCTC 9989 / LMG 20990 / NBRC 107835 / XIL07) TaxID=446471 RepID=D1BTU9_XYLCX|nr:phosphotransferase [Xylanimonas cellulosilytica]ACZ29113.1 aminoglycoside phosphotransferase [Xylanimonas cellulosilytica DSM 15894]